MKNLTLVSFLFLITMTFFSQNQINGFGKLQLGSDLSEVPELYNSVKITNQSDYFSKVYKKTTRDVYEIIADTNDKYCSIGSLDSRVRVFEIGLFNLTDNIEVKGLELRFFNNKLYQIKIEDTKVDDLLTTKYGEPKKDYKEKENTFVNGYGIETIKKDETWIHTWETGNVNTSCFFTLMSYFSDQGKQRVISYTILKDNTISSQIEKQVESVKIRIEKRESEKKKDNLKGF